MYAQADRLEYVRILLEAGCEVNNRDAANHNSMLNLLVKLKRLGDKVVPDFQLISGHIDKTIRHMPYGTCKGGRIISLKWRIFTLVDFM